MDSEFPEPGAIYSRARYVALLSKRHRRVVVLCKDNEDLETGFARFERRPEGFVIRLQPELADALEQSVPDARFELRWIVERGDVAEWHAVSINVDQQGTPGGSTLDDGPSDDSI